MARQGFEKRRPHLEALAAQGRLKHNLEEYLERLDREIKMIQQMKFSGYFLIVWDFIRFAKQRQIPVGPGRGSATGSLVSWAMEITDIDPLQYSLIFERFLNPERVSFPDVDVDFCMNRRGEVIQYVTQKYGREQVAQIITFNTLGARAAIKDVARVLEVPFADVERLDKVVVAPGLQSVDPLIHGTESADHEGGRAVALGAEALDDRKSVLAAKHPVDHQNGSPGTRRPEGVVDRVRQLNPMAVRLQFEANFLGQIEFVLHHEHRRFRRRLGASGARSHRLVHGCMIIL